MNMHQFCADDAVYCSINSDSDSESEILMSSEEEEVDVDEDIAYSTRRSLQKGSKEMQSTMPRDSSNRNGLGSTEARYSPNRDEMSFAKTRRKGVYWSFLHNIARGVKGQSQHC